MRPTPVNHHQTVYHLGYLENFSAAADNPPRMKGASSDLSAQCVMPDAVPLSFFGSLS